jgi:soluble lytic murein transglycosylase
MLSQKSIDHDFITQMIKNKMPDRCLSLIATLSANGQIPNNELIPTLYNLLIHNQTSQFNQIANQNKIENYQLNDTSNPNKYQLVYQISQLAIKTPDEALAKLEQSKTDKFTKQYLYNYVATRLAIKQMFSLALIATNKGHSSYLTDDQFEWKARIFLANNQWSDTLASIKKMPKILQDTNKWLYWKAYAEKKLGRNKQGNTTLGKVSSSPSFYSLLARSELGINPTIPAKIAPNDISSIKYYDYAKLGFDLYSTGTTYNNSYYKNLGTYVLYRLLQ